MSATCTCFGRDFIHPSTEICNCFRAAVYQEIRKLLQPNPKATNSIGLAQLNPVFEKWPEHRAILSYENARALVNGLIDDFQRNETVFVDDDEWCGSKAWHGPIEERAKLVISCPLFRKVKRYAPSFGPRNEAYDGHSYGYHDAHEYEEEIFDRMTTCSPSNHELAKCANNTGHAHFYYTDEDGLVRKVSLKHKNWWIGTTCRVLCVPAASVDWKTMIHSGVVLSGSANTSMVLSGILDQWIKQVYECIFECNLRDDRFPQCIRFLMNQRGVSPRRIFLFNVFKKRNIIRDVIERGASVSIVREICAAYPEDSTTPFGILALPEAIILGASLDIVRAICDAYPNSVKRPNCQSRVTATRKGQK